MARAMIYDVRHVTSVRYDAPVTLARFNLRLEPFAWPGQRLIAYSLAVDPEPASWESGEGPWLSKVSRLAMTQPLSRLRIESRFRMEVSYQAIDPSAPSPTVAALRDEALAMPDLSPAAPAPYLFASPLLPMEPEVAGWTAGIIGEDMPVLDAGTALMAAIHERFAYDSEATQSQTPMIEAFRHRRGVCQDFAHVMIAAARSHGMAAAYVSGYLRTIPPPGQPRLVGADAMHAWVAIWCGRALGWVGFDPTNACLANADHIVIAMGRDYADVSPIDGVFLGQSGQSSEVAVDVTPLPGVPAPAAAGPIAAGGDTG